MKQLEPLVECVPNFSEGKNTRLIEKIIDAISGTPQLTLLDVDPGPGANRTVITMAGAPQAVTEAAFRSIQAAAQLIDLRRHSGAHPRIGATDVCPLIPLANITMEEVVALARALGERVGRELNIPVFLYEQAATAPHRRNLASIRAGEYEGLAAKMKLPEWQPDYGPSQPHPQAGATVIGARPFLIAYNVNLNTASVPIARAIAADVRESGRLLREGDPESGPLARDERGMPIRIPGMRRGLKAIGWYIEEYGCAQVSMNLTDISATHLAEAYEACRLCAAKRGVQVTGSELVGMVPLQVMLDSGRYLRRKLGLSKAATEEELVQTVVRELSLNVPVPFDARRKIIEYRMADLRAAG